MKSKIHKNVLVGSNSVETSYSMADELKHVLSYYKQEKHKVI